MNTAYINVSKTDCDLFVERKKVFALSALGALSSTAGGQIWFTDTAGMVSFAIAAEQAQEDGSVDMSFDDLKGVKSLGGWSSERELKAAFNEMCLREHVSEADFKGEVDLFTDDEVVDAAASDSEDEEWAATPPARPPTPKGPAVCELPREELG